MPQGMAKKKFPFKKLKKVCLSNFRVFSFAAVLSKYLNVQICRFLIRTNDLISHHTLYLPETFSHSIHLFSEERKIKSLKLP